MNTKFLFSLFLLTGASLLVSADEINTTCGSYCVDGVYYTRGGYNAYAGKCAYLTVQCSQGCDPSTNRCRPEPPRSCDGYCSDGIYYHNGTLSRGGLCIYQRITCEYNCNANNSGCAVSSTTEQNNSASNTLSNFSTMQNTNVTQATLAVSNSSIIQTTNVTQATQADNASVAKNLENEEVKIEEVKSATESQQSEEERRVQSIVEPRLPDACFAGCMNLNNQCIPVGIRTSNKYCDIDRGLKPQSEGGFSCNNNYECQSNICLDDKCSDVGLVQKFINFLNVLLSMFGVSDEKTESAVQASDANVVEPVENENMPAPDSSFNVDDNTVEIDVAGVGGVQAVIISGPALEIERIPGFNLGVRNDNPGRITPSSLVFEYEGPAESALENYYESIINGTRDSRLLVMKIRDLSGEEKVLWNYTQYALTSIQSGAYKNKRYTFTRLSGTTFRIGDNRPIFQIDRQVYGIRGSQRDFPLEVSKNPETDTKIEIEGVTNDVYPVVEVNESAQTIMLTFDYIEGGGIWTWMLLFAQGINDKKSMSIILEDPNEHGKELNRTNYFDVWPYKYEQFTGYNQVDKVKERVYLAYAYSRLG